MKSKIESVILTNEQFSRLIIGLFVFSLAFLSLYFGSWILSAVLIFVFWQVNTEFINIVRAKGINPSNKWIRFVSMLFFITASLPIFGLPNNLPLKLFVFVFVFGVIGCFFRLIFRGSKKDPIATIPDVGASVLGFVYTGLLPCFLILLRQLGFSYALIAIVSTAFCDVGAYYGGKLFGRTALKPEISSRKTLEGAISGFISSMIISIILVYFARANFNYNIFHGVIIGLFAGIFSQFGDLFESLLKRDAGLKDSGKALLSHGGILDRVDSYIFVIWAIYFYVSWIVLGQFKL
ncbi:MAG: phosphatidate cytidylyltransferase [Candidatus Melainabacteria bacterium]|nr:phosphatidate cytidylyltransferase [Candidatus Melainabacteria bacterium]